MEIVNDYMLIRPFCEGPFLVHLDESPLTRYQLKSVLKKCLRKLGLHLLNFTSHSFRIGAATKAARMGLEDAIIKKPGRWDSRRFQLYVIPDLSL